MSQPQSESYTAAKGGIAALTHALAASLAGRVRVNSISPGWIDTTPARTSAQHGVSLEGRTITAAKHDWVGIGVGRLREKLRKLTEM